MRKITVAVAIFYLLIFILLQGGAHALSISNEFLWTDNIGPNGGFMPAGHYFYVGAFITPSGSGTTAQATHTSGSGPNYTLGFRPQPIYPDLYFYREPYSGQTGQWNIIATDGVNTVNKITHPLDDPRILPLANNLAISGPLLTPMLTWDAFDSNTYPSVRLPPITLGTDFYNLRVRIRLAESGIPIIYDSPFGPSLYTTATSYTIPAGVLEENKDYLFELMLYHFDTDIVISLNPPNYITFAENQSETFSFYSTTPVPEPSTMLLLGSGLIGLLGLRKKFKK
jgi:hypothetical protein